MVSDVNINGDVGSDNGDEAVKVADDAEDDQWEQVGRKNKSVITRSVSCFTTTTLLREKS